MNLKSIVPIILFGLILASCDNEPVDDTLLTGEPIAVNSAMYNLIEDVSTSGGPEDIDCINFIYPLTIFTFDEDLDVVGIEKLENDMEFSNLLGSLSDEQSISVSYPIAATLSDGTAFLIEDNEQLKNAIDNCLMEELRGKLGETMEDCVWRVEDLMGFDDTYSGGIFHTDDGATILNFEGDLYIGSMTALVIEFQLFLNISLTIENSVSEYWNQNWKTEYIGNDKILLINEDRKVMLKKICEDEPSCNPGYTFNECAIPGSSIAAEFPIDEYEACIRQLLADSGYEVDGVDLEFYSSLLEAEEQNNPIDISIPYISDQITKNIWIRVQSSEGELLTIIQIELRIIEC